MLKIARIGWENTKKRRNKKADESITPIRYNVMRKNLSLINFHAILWLPPILVGWCSLPYTCIYTSIYTSGILGDSLWSLTVHFVQGMSWQFIGFYVPQHYSCMYTCIYEWRIGAICSRPLSCFLYTVFPPANPSNFSYCKCFYVYCSHAFLVRLLNKDVELVGSMPS